MLTLEKNIKFHSYLWRLLNASWPFILCSPLPFIFFGSPYVPTEIIFCFGILLIGYIQGFHIAKIFIEKINIGQDVTTIIYYSFFKKREITIPNNSIITRFNRGPASVQMVDFSSLEIQSNTEKIVQFSFWGWSRNDFNKIIAALEIPSVHT
jgi:hypothetical protein